MEDITKDDVNPLIPLAVMAGVYYYTTHMQPPSADDDEYPTMHIVAYALFLYYLREHVVAPEVIAITAPLAVSNLATESGLSSTKATAAGLASLLIIRHMRGPATD